LIGFLRAQVDILDNESGDVEERRRKVVWERVPREVVDDPGGVVRELEWRVKRELRRLGIGEEKGKEEKRGEVVKEEVGTGGRKGPVGGGDKKRKSVIPLPISRMSDFPTE
jgi:hypothetical protein